MEAHVDVFAGYVILETATEIEPVAGPSARLLPWRDHPRDTETVHAKEREEIIGDWNGAILVIFGVPVLGTGNVEECLGQAKPFWA